jgi:hypothetical protein
MNKYILILFSFLSILGCQKDSELQTAVFPGITGSGNDAIWVVYTHTISDRPFITAYALSQTPPLTFNQFDTSYVLARQREVTQYSYRFYKGGEIAFIGKSSGNQNIWIKQPNLKWEEVDNQIVINRITSGTPEIIAIGFPDQDKVLFRLRRSYFGDTSADKNRTAMEVLYSLFN